MLIKNEIYTREELEEINKELSTSIPNLTQQEKEDLINGFIKTFDPINVTSTFDELKEYINLHNSAIEIVNKLSLSEKVDKRLVDLLKTSIYRLKYYYKYYNVDESLKSPIPEVFTKLITKEEKESKDFGIFTDINSKLSNIFNGLRKTPIEKPTEEEVNKIIRDYNTLVDKIDPSDSDSKFHATSIRFKLQGAVKILSLEGIKVSEQISTK